MNKIPVGFRDIERIESCKARGIVHQSVNAPEMPLHLFEERFNFRDSLKIGAEDRRIVTFGCGCTGFGFGAVIVNRDARAFPRQAQSDASADALGRASDQDYSSFERFHSLNITERHY